MMRLERRASLLVALFLLTSRDGLRRVRVCAMGGSPHDNWRQNHRRLWTSTGTFDPG
jgi:hypothetical protein